jgi:hypothetical protein
MVQRIQVGYHVINRAQPPQLLGEPGVATASDGDLVQKLYKSLQNEKHPRLKDVHSSDVKVWRLLRPVEFPFAEDERNKFARSLQLMERGPFLAQTDADEIICQRIHPLFEIKGENTEWPSDRICLLFQVPGSEFSLQLLPTPTHHKQLALVRFSLDTCFAPSASDN